MLQKHSEENLKILTLNSFKFTEEFILENKLVFSRLVKLNQGECSAENTVRSEIFKSCSKLEDLTIRVFLYNSQLMPVPVTIPTLKSLIIRIGYGITNQHITRFIEMNPQLKNITIRINCRKITIEIIQSIAQHITNVQKLELSLQYPKSAAVFYENANYLKRLPSLKLLKFDCSSVSCATYVAQLVSQQILSNNQFA